MTPQGAFAGEPGDFRAQATQCFENLKAGLASVGAGFEHVVKITNFFIDMAHLPVFFEVRDKYVNTKAPPASTAIQVGRLAREGALFEVEAVAVIPDRAAKAARRGTAVKRGKPAKKADAQRRRVSDAFSANRASSRACQASSMSSAAARRTASLTYVGWTTDMSGGSPSTTAGTGARTTRGRAWVLLHTEKFRTRRQAMSREWYLKRDRKFRRTLTPAPPTRRRWRHHARKRVIAASVRSHGQAMYRHPRRTWQPRRGCSAPSRR